jgi:hypothetical protein
VHVKTYNDKLNELQVIESRRNAIRNSLVYELMNAQDTVLYTYFAQRNGERDDSQNQSSTRDYVCETVGIVK